MSDCKHEQFLANVEVHRKKDSIKSEVITGYSADIKINCSECGQAFEFIGVPCGYNSNQPTASVDYTQLRIPVRPSASPVVKDKNKIVN